MARSTPRDFQKERLDTVYNKSISVKTVDLQHIAPDVLKQWLVGRIEYLPTERKHEQKIRRRK